MLYFLHNGNYKCMEINEDCLLEHVLLLSNVCMLIVLSLIKDCLLMKILLCFGIEEQGIFQEKIVLCFGIKIWDSCTIHHCWYSSSKWSCRETKQNVEGNGEEHDDEPKFLWEKVLKITMHRVPSKSVPKTPFEQSTGMKPSLLHFMFGVVTLKLKRSLIQGL
ncbi:hypothetical protein PRUPE_1G445900 [Prunus persica]|uniref:Uncharacterized protein n=1 Tax=Prunus persica TaxID=3760 RepID=A0A251RCP7_PRUPE|nr:hypothetical protein PRUPE_1G445900 [Prunus persica]